MRKTGWNFTGKVGLYILTILSLFVSTSAVAAVSDALIETLYKRFASTPKGLTQQDVVAYLSWQLQFDPLYKALHGKDKLYDAALPGVLKQQLSQALQFQSPNGHLDPIGFRNYLLANPPKGTDKLATARPTPSGFLDRITYNSTTNKSFLQDSHFHVTKSAPQPGASTTLPGGADPGPAQFTWTRAANTKSVFTVDVAASYDFGYVAPNQINILQQLYDFEAFLTPSLEVHEDSDPKSKQDSIQAQLQFQALLSPDPSNWFDVHVLSITPTFQRDTVKKIDAYGAQIFYTPIPKLAGFAYAETLNFWGNFRSGIAMTKQELALRACPEFLLLPSIGIETGQYSNDVTALPPGLDRDYTRLAAKLHLDFWVVPQFDIAVDYVHRTLLTGGDQSFDYVEISPVLYLDFNQPDPSQQHFAVGMSFKYGKTAPLFQDVRSISAWLGIKF